MMRVRAIVTTLVLCFAASAVRAEEAQTQTSAATNASWIAAVTPRGYQSG